MKNQRVEHETILAPIQIRLKPSPWLRLIFLLIVIWQGVAVVKAQNFRIAGTLIYEICAPHPYQSKSTNFFEMEVHEGRSLMLVSNVNRVSQLSFDAGTIHELDSRLGGGKSGFVKIRELPEDSRSCFNYLWLAFASDSYFQSVTNHHLKPVWILNDPQLNDETFTVKAVWSKSDQFPYLPRRIDYLTDGIERSNLNGHRITRPAIAPYNLGYTNAVFESSGPTNLHGCELPTDFKFTRFGISTDKLVTVSKISAHVTCFESAPAQMNLKPRFTGSASIMDTRFKLPHSATHSNPLNYEVKNGVWPSLREIQPLYDRELKNRLHLPRIADKPRKLG